MCLMSTIRQFIHENGGEEMLANLIIAESPEFFHKGDECGNAISWLRKRGIFSNEDIPKRGTMRVNFTVSELEYIITMADKASVKEISTMLCIPEKVIDRKIYELESSGILPNRELSAAPEWTECELGYLVAHAEKNGNVELSDALGRSTGAVSTRKYMMGLKMDPLIAKSLIKEYRRKEAGI